jgi:hypothetical protein
MGTEEHYPNQGQMCRKQVLLRPDDPGTRAIWRKLAEEYERLAEATTGERPPTVNGS